MPEEIAQQEQRALLGVMLDRTVTDNVRASGCVELGNDPSVREQDHRDRSGDRLEREQQQGAANEGDGVRDRAQSPKAPGAVSLRSSTRARQ